MSKWTGKSEFLLEEASGELENLLADVRVRSAFDDPERWRGSIMIN